MTETNKGVAYGVGAYLLWGAMASYLGLLTHIPAIEIAAHRALWSLPVAALMLVLGQGGLAETARVMKSPRILATLGFSSLLIAGNWAIYIWSIEQHRTLESALGYYINPLLNVLVGYLFLKERFTRAQQVALALAGVAVGLQTLSAGVFPWVGLTLAASFCAYGFIRKQVPVSAAPGFFVEVLLLSVPAAFYIGSGLADASGHFLVNARDSALLFGLGAFTAAPLLLYAACVRRLRYSTVGVLQYISPSLVFLTAIFIFHEPMSLFRLSAFGLLWVALAIYTVSALKEDKARRGAAGQAVTSSAAQV